MVQFNKREVSEYIYAQFMEHYYFEASIFVEPTVKTFTRIEGYNYSKYTKYAPIQYRETVTPTNSIPTKVFIGFLKASNASYKFDSKTEKDFTIVVEDNKDVVKWLHPAGNQFHI